MLDMKKIFFPLIVSISLIVIILQGCIDQNNPNGVDNSVFVTASVDTLGLNLSELPEGIFEFVTVYNDTHQVDIFTDENITRVEQYTVDYRNESEEEYLLLELRKIESVEGAKKVFDFQKNVFSDYLSDEISTEGIGDQSIMGKVSTKYHLLLRKYNIIIALTSADDIGNIAQKLIDYATIIINNIESNIVT